MALSGPFLIRVKSLPRSDAMTTSAECAPVSFAIPSGGKFDTWTWVPGSPKGDKPVQLKNVGNGGVVTARDGVVVVCREPGPHDQTFWQILPNGDGTYTVALLDAKLIWSASQSGLILTSSQKKITDSEIFGFPPA